MGESGYTPIRLDRQQEYLARFAQCPQRASDYTFTNIWGWAEEYGLEWSWGDSHVWLRQTRPEILDWAPVGPWDRVDWARCPRLTKPGTYTRVPEQLLELWRQGHGPRMRVEEARGHWDYLYLVGDLIELKGKTFHKKKNHLNQFFKHYDFTFFSMSPECVEETLALQQQWCLWRECEDSAPLVAENQAIARVLQHWDTLHGMLGGALYVGGNMIAYTVAEALDADTLVIHFEKGRPEFRGVYQAINQQFLAHEGRDFALVNREQDLDDASLRKAKLSYRPVEFLKKYSVHLD